MNANKTRGIFQIGDVLNNTYRIEDVLGRGGTSEVYKARSEISGRVMALKALRHEFSRNDDFLALMTREEDMREIRHDAIVRYYDNQRTDDGLVYLVMDYVEGPGLDKKIAQGGMSADDLLIVAKRVAEGLRAAHAKKIVHRDLSPDNIILRHGDPSDAVIIDFGIAKDTNEGAQTIVGNEFAGKYAYAAPEQLSGQTDARADIYALGALLLATFLGKKPDIGANPMEVIERKAQPLDTSDVPEPLRTLIDKMTHPDREIRLQTAQAVLDQIEGPSSVVDAAPLDFGDDDSDKTIIVPRPGVPKPEKITPKAKPSSGGSGAKIAAMVLVLVAAIGAGGYFGGVFDGLMAPAYPVANPYELIARRAADNAPLVVGHVPSEETQTELSSLMEELGGSAELTLSSGDIPENWGADIVQLISLISVLPEWQLVAEGAELRITGTTDDATQSAQLNALFQNDGLPDGLTGSAEINFVAPILAAETLSPILREHANCGPLTLIDPPSAGYGETSQVLVLGKVADVATRVALSDDLVATIGGRDLILNIDVLNPTLCEVDAVLPNVPEGGFGITFRMGSDGTENSSGRYFVGENPVIDITIPADVTDGFLFVSALDVSGNVFHLMPNVLLPDNAVADLRKGASGPVTVRVAFPLAEAADGTKLAFSVDDSTLGKTRIVILHADEQIHQGLRPMTESAGGYAQALGTHSGVVRTLDSRILTTAKP
ncbi:MAG: serine/threonine-protein kinase [Sulfitobacter sp.]